MSESGSKSQVKSRGTRRTEVGEVISTKMAKTAVVKVVRVQRHPRYETSVRKAVRFFVHDEEGKARDGDTVLIMETKPLSKKKRWRLVRVLRHEHGEA